MQLSDRAASVRAPLALTDVLYAPQKVNDASLDEAWHMLHDYARRRTAVWRWAAGAEAPLSPLEIVRELADTRQPRTPERLARLTADVRRVIDAQLPSDVTVDATLERLNAPERQEQLARLEPLVANPEALQADDVPAIWSVLLAQLTDLVELQTIHDPLALDPMLGDLLITLHEHGRQPTRRVLLDVLRALSRHVAVGEAVLN